MNSTVLVGTFPDSFPGPSMVVDPGNKKVSFVPESVMAGIRGKYANQIARLKWDAAMTGASNLLHWQYADNLSPDAAASYTVRRKLRSRSRYEVIENNPYLKGILLTICNDFTGSGPKLQLTDTRFSSRQKQLIERRWRQRSKRTKLRQRLWQARMAKTVDGETFLMPYLDNQGNIGLRVYECDQFSSDAAGIPLDSENMVDGIRYDNNGEPSFYYRLNSHPGSQFSDLTEGEWIPARYVYHWFRRDRSWLRGIPELAPSLPLCAILRRYTLATLRAAETAADFAAVLETDGPPNQTLWTDGAGNPIQDDPFDLFQIEAGMMTTLPYGYHLKQFDAKHPQTTYDTFVDALVKEIVRPLLVPFNVAVGSSKDVNMASGVLDIHGYKSAVKSDRLHCEEDVLDPDFLVWWTIQTREGLDNVESLFLENPTLYEEVPDHIFRWDQVNLEHTDPLKVAGALEKLHTKRFITDRDIQEIYYNRDLEDWQDEVLSDDKFRGKLNAEDVEGNGTRIPEEGEEEEE